MAKKSDEIIKLSRIKTRVFGYGFAYLLNAYNDAHIAYELMKKTDSKDHRIDHILEYVKDPGELQACAYSQYYWNGMYDYVWGYYLLQKLRVAKRTDVIEYMEGFLSTFKEEMLLEQDVYNEFDVKFWTMVTPLWDFAGGKMTYRSDFEKKFGTNIDEVPYEKFKNMALYTQHVNINSNRGNAKKLLEDDYTDLSFKGQLIVQASKKLNRPKTFIHAAANTLLNGASGWDRLFSWYTKVFC